MSPKLELAMERSSEIGSQPELVAPDAGLYEEGLCEDLWRHVFRDAGDAMLLVDDVIVNCNQAAMKLLRANREQLVGRELQDLYGPGKESPGSCVAFLAEVTREEYSFLRADGTSLPVAVTLNRVGGVGSNY